MFACYRYLLGVLSYSMLVINVLRQEITVNIDNNRYQQSQSLQNIDEVRLTQLTNSLTERRMHTKNQKNNFSTKRDFGLSLIWSLEFQRRLSSYNLTAQDDSLKSSPVSCVGQLVLRKMRDVVQSQPWSEACLVIRLWHPGDFGLLFAVLSVWKLGVIGAATCERPRSRPEYMARQRRGRCAGKSGSPRINTIKTLRAASLRFFDACTNDGTAADMRRLKRDKLCTLSNFKNWPEEPTHCTRVTRLWQRITYAKEKNAVDSDFKLFKISFALSYFSYAWD